MEKPKAKIEVIAVTEGEVFELAWEDAVVRVDSEYDPAGHATIHELTIVRRGQ